MANAEPKSQWQWQWHVLNGVTDHGRVVPGREGAERCGRREGESVLRAGACNVGWRREMEMEGVLWSISNKKH